MQVYDEEYVIDLSKLEPTVAFPHLPENTKTVKEAGDVKIRSGCDRILYKWSYRGSSYSGRDH